MLTNLKLSRRAAVTLVMHHKNLPKAAGTSYRRVATTYAQFVSGHRRQRETGWFGHVSTYSGGNVNADYSVH